MRRHIPVPRIIGVISVVLLGSATYYYLAYVRVNLAWSDSGDFRKMFGAVSALFTGLAFVEVSITYHIRLRKSIANRSAADIQKFEARFLHLLNVHDELIRGMARWITVSGHHILVKGQEQIVSLYSQYVDAYIEEYTSNVMAAPADIIKRSFSTFFYDNKPLVRQYFRHLCYILTFLDSAKFLSFREKKFYMKLIQSRLSSHEILLLFYNCLSKKGMRKFKLLVERYSLLEDMPDDLLIPNVRKLENHEHKALYDKQAFKRE